MEKGIRIGQKEEIEGDWGRGSRFPFAVFFLFPSRGFLRLTSQVIEFAQNSFTVHNKVVVTENLGSVLQFHLKDIEQSSDVYS